MASRQQREIAQQKRLLEQREARLAVLRGAQEPAQQDRLARLRHRLDQQQTKLNRLRLLRSQTDQSRVSNATLTSDLDCIRALFNEKEKELSVAVAKVDELTRQLEDLRGQSNIVGNSAGGLFSTSASAELEKLRRELLYRNNMNEQQNKMVSQQRLALAQKQAEMASIDARIAQLQGRLQRKRALNQRLSQQLKSTNRSSTNQAFLDSKVDFTNNGKSRPAGNIAAIEPFSHIPSDDFNLKKTDPKYQTLPYNTKFAINFKGTDDDVNINNIQHSASASQVAQRSVYQQVGHVIVHSQSQTHVQGKFQPLGTNQQQLHNNSHISVNQSSSNFNVNANNNSNNNNNNKNSNQNKYILENQTSSQIFRIHGVQQSQQQGNLQQKCPNAVNILNSNLASNTQIVSLIKNHGNVKTHQKPVSSVAPSFPVKSPIYQTSSTKIHPVMPQTLSLIGRVHSGTQNYNALSVQSQNNQLSANIQSNVNQDLNCLSRLNQLVTTHHPQENITLSTTNQAQGSQTAAQSIPSLSVANSNFNNYSIQSVRQPQGICTMAPVNEPLIDKLKFEHAKNPGKFEHLSPTKHESQIRHEQNGLMYDSPLNKYEQHDKYDQATQPVKLCEQSPKHDQSNFYKTNVYENAGKHDLNSAKQEGSHTKLEQHIKLDNPIKYDHGSIVQQVKQHEQHDTHSLIKFNQTLSFKHELVGKYDTSKESQLKLDQVNYEQNQSNFENTTTKYEHNVQLSQNDHTIKFEALNKLSEKPSEYEKLIAEHERKITFNELKCEEKTKPTLPPKPSKPNLPPRLTNHEKLELIKDMDDSKAIANKVVREENEEEIPPMPTSEPPESPTQFQSGNQQIIKSRPLNLKKVPLSEQPKLRYSKSNIHVSINRRIEMPPAFLFPETEIPADLIQADIHQYQHSQQQTSNQTVNEEFSRNEKLENIDIVDALNVINIDDKIKMQSDKDRKSEVEFESKPAEVTRRKKGNLKSTTGKANLSRRVSFDPLALLLDASLEGELELVKKTAKEVSNPSSANDEGITALHNAICAGHLEIVKFLVEFGCDVNAQDSDGWTPLHCAASCNNLAMVRFLVEHGACIFATTLSDHETAAEKCEEDEEGFDGCSEYLYSVQEKLGIMNNGQVFVLFDYSPQHSDELLLKNGDSLVVLRKGDDDEREWWWSKLGNKEGYVPRNLLGLYPRVKPIKVDRNYFISTKDQ